ncbi:myelin basic protein isoform X3 [Pogona vitticeps]
MGNNAGKRDQSTEKVKNPEAKVEGSENKTSSKAVQLTQEPSEDNEVFGEADVNQNNGTSTKSTAVTDSKGTVDPKNAWKEANPADTTGRPHLVRLFSRDAPGREDNTFKDRPSESDELQTIQEDSAAASENSDLMASQKRSSFRHGSKLATASTIDHARHGSPRRYREPGLLDSLGRFFGGDRHVPRRGKCWLRKNVFSHRSKYLRSAPHITYEGHESTLRTSTGVGRWEFSSYTEFSIRRNGKVAKSQDYHHAARASHVSSLPHPRSQHGRYVDDNPVVHFFKSIVSPRTTPPLQAKGRGSSFSRFSWGSSGSRPGSRSGSPIARR